MFVPDMSEVIGGISAFFTFPGMKQSVCVGMCLRLFVTHKRSCVELILCLCKTCQLTLRYVLQGFAWFSLCSQILCRPESGELSSLKL
jgi:hypothetical protein